MICIFAVILIFLLALGHAVDKMCVSHANENGIYFLHFNFFLIWLMIDLPNPTKNQPSIKKKIVALQNSPENPKTCAAACLSHKMFAPLEYIR